MCVGLCPEDDLKSKMISSMLGNMLHPSTRGQATAVNAMQK